jgi:putative endonuclease
MFYVYALRSKIRKYIYVGMTNDLARRFKEHNNKRESTTRSYAPFELLSEEKYETRIEARKREKYLKSRIGREYLKKLK